MKSLCPVQFWIETDVSLEGWGACLDDKTSGGRWTNVESTYHINYLELLSIFNALKALCANSNEALDELACKIWL